MKKILPALAIPAVALTLVGAGVASANGGWSNINPEDAAKHLQTRFENEASILGISVNEVKDNWAAGKTLPEIAKAKGISEQDLKTKMQAQRKQMQQTRLKALVDAGVITQSQADQRLQFEQSRPERMEQPSGGRGGMKMHRGGMMGFGGGQPPAENQQ